VTETYLARKQVAARFNVSMRTVDRWILDGKMRPTRIGRTVRIAESDIARFLSGEAYAAASGKEE
jgi:excisionase family DNA binding protein